MTHELLTEYRVRRQVVELLSEPEAARLAKALATGRLQVGEEYVEVDHTARGVQRIVAGTSPRGRIILRRAVDELTWSQIITLLGGVRER
jgi:hypothetical protein